VLANDTSWIAYCIGNDCTTLAAVFFGILTYWQFDCRDDPSYGEIVVVSMCQMWNKCMSSLWISCVVGLWTEVSRVWFIQETSRRAVCDEWTEVECSADNSRSAHTEVRLPALYIRRWPTYMLILHFTAYSWAHIAVMSSPAWHPAQILYCLIIETFVRNCWQSEHHWFYQRNP